MFEEVNNDIDRGGDWFSTLPAYILIVLLVPLCVLMFLPLFSTWLAGRLTRNTDRKEMDEDQETAAAVDVVHATPQPLQFRWRRTEPTPPAADPFPIGTQVHTDCEACGSGCTRPSDFVWTVEDPSGYYCPSAKIRLYHRRSNSSQSLHFGCPRRHVSLVYKYTIRGNELILEEQ